MPSITVIGRKLTKSVNRSITLANSIEMKGNKQNTLPYNVRKGHFSKFRCAELQVKCSKVHESWHLGVTFSAEFKNDIRFATLFSFRGDSGQS